MPPLSQTQPPPHIYLPTMSTCRRWCGWVGRDQPRLRTQPSRGRSQVGDPCVSVARVTPARCVCVPVIVCGGGGVCVCPLDHPAPPLKLCLQRGDVAAAPPKPRPHPRAHPAPSLPAPTPTPVPHPRPIPRTPSPSTPQPPTPTPTPRPTSARRVPRHAGRDPPLGLLHRPANGPRGRRLVAHLHPHRLCGVPLCTALPRCALPAHKFCGG